MVCMQIRGTPAVISIYVNGASWNSCNNPENGSQANELIVDDEDEDDNILPLRLFNNDDLDNINFHPELYRFDTIDGVTGKAIAKFPSFRVGDDLYLLVVDENNKTQHISRDGLVTVLDKAEEMDCSHVFVVFPSQSEDRDTLIKIFMYVGFHVVLPGRMGTPSNPSFIYMCLEIEKFDDDDD
ncbi:expressed hypothetical protein [Trichoplax adhaerens]|uniref:Ornithine decarboxylase antizyme n=1 Tax=Trichoplax adhaerens TaxID=10228 RepID=B3RM60_TRIAD|nr:expressed hypothetical protein [Trichoplax adhaerens]EDV29640.1 expressed hypothetical protein [Trichoplax adhaerens]|eukprot:XP_002108842.1 expressed hypothetical protein [Trichoplax adhaerens]